MAVKFVLFSLFKGESLCLVSLVFIMNQLMLDCLIISYDLGEEKLYLALLLDWIYDYLEPIDCKTITIYMFVLLDPYMAFKRIETLLQKERNEAL